MMKEDPTEVTSIALLGDRNLELVTHRAADAATALFPSWAMAEWVATDSVAARELDRFAGVWVLSGSPYRDDDAVLRAIQRRRELEVPLLGTCAGFQYMVLEYARNVAGLPTAAHVELDPDNALDIVTALACPLDRIETTVTAVPGTILAKLCGSEPFPAFHWCGFGINDRYRGRLVAAGLTISAVNDDAGTEAVELPAPLHPFFVGTAFQPQMDSLARAPALHPILRAFLTASYAARAGPGESSRRIEKAFTAKA